MFENRIKVSFFFTIIRVSVRSRRALKAYAQGVHASISKNMYRSQPFDFSEAGKCRQQSAED